MGTYLTDPSEFEEYQRAMAAFNQFIPHPAPYPWSPQTATTAATSSTVPGTVNNPSHLHSHQDPSSSSSSTIPPPSHPIPAFTTHHPHPHFHQQQQHHHHHQQHHHVAPPRPMMSENGGWSYATTTTTPAPQPQMQQPSDMMSNAMLNQQQYGAQFMPHAHPATQHQQSQQQSHQLHHHHHHHQQQHHSPQQQLSGAGLSSANLTGLDFRMAQQQQQQQQQAQQQQEEAAMNQRYAMTTTGETQQYMPYTAPPSMDYGPLSVFPQDLNSGLAGYPIEAHRLRQDPQQMGHSPPFGQAGTLLGTSPESNFEIQSSSDSDSGWQILDSSQGRSSFDTYDMSSQQPTNVSDPSVTLQLRTTSDATNPDTLGSASSIHSFSSYDDSGFPMGSPNSDGSSLELAVVPAHTQPQPIRPYQSDNQSSSAAMSSPSSSSSPTSPTEASSPTKRRKNEPVIKTTITSVAKVKKPATQTKKTGEKEKRVGRRKGPLRPEQRAQAGEIRKLRACLRCKFLKKTCDKGDPCAGCQPAHARLWQVPCTRIDIKEIGYFVKDWSADYQRHMTLGFSIANIRGYSPLEHTLFITHGFGFCLPISAREVFVRDEDCFNVDWVETNKEKPEEFESPTARLTAGIDGVSMPDLSTYLDRHLEQGFVGWVDKHFEGTAFLTEMLKTAYSYWKNTGMTIIYKALKLILAYNLTFHVTMLEGLSDEENITGKIDDENSKYFGKTLAPVMINFQVKHALAMMWRDLQREVLEELSALYSSVYNGERLKNWPTIFMLATILLAVWEEIQFDSHYRMPDPDTVKKFCNEMESTPVGVIVGLFSAISQKLPAFQEWDTEKHKHLLNSNQPICDALTEVREHVLKYEDYLKSRADCKFNRGDFDCLSNKFLSKLVIRAN